VKINSDHRYSKRAVAPIIATLLMVAISVVGGILIFVFAQGFFTDTNIQTPNVESLEIYGYDARDRAALRTHIFDPTATEGAAGGTPTISTAPTSTTIGLRDDNAITVTVRNKGAGPITIDKVVVFGADYTWSVSTTATTLSTTTPAVATSTARFFAISTDGLATTTSPVIGPGQDATVIIRYDDTTNGPVKIGRPIPVVIVTGGGSTFTKQVQNGVTVGI
jgi:archaeal type IV pilus assembly protein PilA